MVAGTTAVAVVTVMVVRVPHEPLAGVKVYAVVPAFAVLMTAGLQVPLIPLMEVVGKAAGVVPMQ